MSTTSKSTESKEDPDDTGLGQTIYSSVQQESLTPQHESNEQGQGSHTVEAVDTTNSQASSTSIISSYLPFKLQQTSEKSPIGSSEDRSRNTRPRTLTAKGQAFNSELKRKIALTKDKEFRSKLTSFEGLVHSCRDSDRIKSEISMMATHADCVIQAIDNWIELLQDTAQMQHASNKQSYLVDTGKPFMLPLWIKYNDFKKKKQDLFIVRDPTNHVTLAGQGQVRLHVERHSLIVKPRDQHYKRS